MPDIFERRLKNAMRDSADIAEEIAYERDVELPSELVGQMGLTLFQARLGVLRRQPSSDGIEFPDEDGREVY